MRMLHLGLRITDLERSLAFCTAIGYAQVGRVPETEFGSLTMLQLPDDPFVSLELIHDPAHPVKDMGAVNHLVIQVDDMDATVSDLAAKGVTAAPPAEPGPGMRTSWLPAGLGHRRPVHQHLQHRRVTLLDHADTISTTASSTSTRSSVRRARAIAVGVGVGRPGELVRPDLQPQRTIPVSSSISAVRSSSGMACSATGMTGPTSRPAGLSPVYGALTSASASAGTYGSTRVTRPRPRTCPEPGWRSRGCRRR